MKLNYTFSSKEEMDLIHEKTLEILESVGVAFHEEESLEIFKKNGAKTSGNIVYIGKDLLEKALSTVPKSFQWHGRKSLLTIGDGNSIAVPSYGPIYRKIENKFCDITPNDFVEVHKLHETSEVLDAGNPNVMEPTAIPAKIRRNYQMATSLKYHTKPVMGMVDGKIAAKDSVRMAQEFYDTKDKNLLVGLINVMSPLGMSTAMCEALIIYARNRQAVIIAEGGFPGVTLPPSMAGTLISNNAGILSGIVLTQLVNPGTPVIYGLPAVSGDLRAVSMAIGGAETALFVRFAREIGNYYQIPVRAGGGLTDAKEVDYQAGKETALNLHATYESKIDFILHACGILDTYNTISFEKLVLDEETIKMVKRQVLGFSIDEKRLMMDAIVKAGPGGSFLSRKTSKIYREEFFLPKLDNRITTQNWIKEGEESVLMKAEQMVSDRIEGYELPRLEEFQKKILEDNIPKEFR